MWEKKRNVTLSLHTHKLIPNLYPWNSPGHNTEVGSLSLLQGIFTTQGSNTGLPHCRQILYQLSHKGSPSGKGTTCQCRRLKRCGLDPWVGKIPWRRKWQLTLVFLSGKSRGRRSLVATVCGVAESNTTEHTLTQC